MNRHTRIAFVGRVTTLGARVSAPPSVKSGDAALLEQRAAAFLAEGKFRKAREEAKLLRKLDAARGLPLLVRANVGLAREMMSKGLVSEAQQVLAYLATIATPAELRAIETELAGHTGDFAPAAQNAVRTLAGSTDALGEAERLRMADLLVLAFDDPPADTPGGAALTAELRAIHAALRALAEQQWSGAHDALRPVPQRSVFSHWKLFLKGLLAFHQGDAARARRYLDELPPESVPARAATPYRLLLTPEAHRRATPPPDERTVGSLGGLLGHPGIARPLARAEHLWRQGKAAESYRAIRDGVSGFPSERPDLIGTLTDFYFNAIFKSPQQMRDDLARGFDEALARRRPGDALERALMFRALGLYQVGEDDAYSLQADWQGFLDAYEQAHGPNPRLASLTLAFLGEQLARPASGFGFPLFQRRTEMLDARGALHALERSVALDPRNLGAALKLCDLYERLGRSSDHNRRLDDMVEQFPESKQVLLRAGRRCVDRRAFVKGLDYLNRARQLDRLDPALAREAVRAIVGLAAEQFKKQRADAARATLKQLDEFAADHTTNLACARWCLIARRAALEALFGEPGQVEPLLTDACATAPAREAVLLYAHLAQLDLQRSRYDEPTRFSRELVTERLQSATLAQGLHLIRIHEFWTGSDEDARISDQGTLLVQQYLVAAQKAPFSDDEVRRLTEQGGGRGLFDGAADRFVRRVLSRDRQHPWFRLYQIMAKPFGPDGSPKEERELRAIIEEAGRRGDSETVQRARQLLDRRDVPPPPLPPPPPEAWDDEPDDDVPPIPGGRGRRAQASPVEDEPEFDPNDPYTIEALAAEIRRIPEGQLRRLRKQMAKKGLPGFLFDLLVDAARAGGPLPNLPPIPRPPSRGPRPPDPNQLDLF